MTGSCEAPELDASKKEMEVRSTKVEAPLISYRAFLLANGRVLEARALAWSAAEGISTVILWEANLASPHQCWGQNT